MRTLLLAIVFCVIAAAQTPDQPQFFVAAGGSYSHYTAPPVAAGWMTFGIKVADKTYSFSTIDMTPTVATARTGVSRVLVQSGNVTLMALGDAGMATLGGVTLGSFSGGGLLIYDLAGVNKRLAHIHVVALVRVVAINATMVQPTFGLGIGRSF